MSNTAKNARPESGLLDTTRKSSLAKEKLVSGGKALLPISLEFVENKQQINYVNK